MHYVTFKLQLLELNNHSRWAAYDCKSTQIGRNTVCHTIRGVCYKPVEVTGEVTSGGTLKQKIR